MKRISKLTTLCLLIISLCVPTIVFASEKSYSEKNYIVEYGETRREISPYSREMINWTIKNNIQKETNSFTLKKGSAISFHLNFSITSGVTVGIIDSNKKKTYIKAKPSGSVVAPENGKYRVFILNQSGKTLMVTGAYTR